MKYIIKQKSDLKASDWGGGSTTQLFIYPKGCCYKQRDFKVRISLATVDVSPSIFTPLPDYKRVLMPLTAPLRLVINDKELVASPFDCVEFEGGQRVVSHGKCTDIGIMFTPDWDCKLFGATDGAFKCSAGFTGVYALANNIKINAAEKEHILMQGDFLIFSTDNKQEIAFNLPAKNAAVVACVTKRDGIISNF